MPTGFRAPGYTTSETLWQALVATGFQWSSSALPSPTYLAARTLVRWRTRLGGGVAVTRGILEADAAGLYGGYGNGIKNLSERPD